MKSCFHVSQNRRASFKKRTGIIWRANRREYNLDVQVNRSVLHQFENTVNPLYLAFPYI